MLLLEYKGTLASLRFLNCPGAPHYEVVILGRTKGNQISGSRFKIPVAATTSGSNLNPGEWMKRYTSILNKISYKGKRLFSKSSSTARLEDFEEDFYQVLERVQSSCSVIPSDVNVREEFGLRRSLRRGVTSHAINLGIPDDLIVRINRWRKEQRGKSTRMIDLYSSIEALKPALLKFSGAL